MMGMIGKRVFRGGLLAASGMFWTAVLQAAAAGGPVPMTRIPLPSVCGDDRPVQNVELPATVAQALNLQPKLLIAEANELASRSDVKSAAGGFLPQIDLSAVDERYVPSNGSSPVVVVGNTVLGGPQTKSAYGSLSLQWNVWNNGRDVAALRGARAGVRAAAYGVDHQLDDTLIGVLGAYAELYEAEVTARADAQAAAGLTEIRTRAEKRYAQGYGTEVAVGQARVAALNAEQTLNGACRDLDDKSAALAQAVGLEMSSMRRLRTLEPLPQPASAAQGQDAMESLVDASPAVGEARENMIAAQRALQRALGEFGPTVSLSVRRDYLGQDPDSFGRANSHIAPADYRIGLEFEQPLFPLSSQGADVDKARAELRKSQASYKEARIDVQTKLLGAWSARLEAERSFTAAESSLADAEQVLALTRAQFHAGREDLDAVEHATMDRDTALADLEKLGAERAIAQWQAARATFPRDFPALVFRELHLEMRPETAAGGR
jgi:outer membrane protein TolC